MATYLTFPQVLSLRLCLEEYEFAFTGYLHDEQCAIKVYQNGNINIHSFYFYNGDKIESTWIVTLNAGD